MGCVLLSSIHLQYRFLTTGRHKDYVYQKRLAHALPLDSYRFDFRSVSSSLYLASPTNTP
jgi:hypothetical protein